MFWLRFVDGVSGMTIRKKLALAFMLTTLLPVLLVSTFSINQTREQAYAEFLDASNREIRQVDNAFSMYFKGMAENVEYLASMPVMQRLDDSLAKYVDKPTAPMTPLQNSRLEQEIFSRFDQFGQAHPDLSYVYMGTEDGGYIQWPITDLGNYDPRQRPWYKQAMASPGQTLTTDAYYWAADDAAYIATVKTLQDRSGRQVGVMSMDVSLKKLTDIVRQIKLGETGYLMLVEDNGNIIVDPANPDNNFKQISALEGAAYATLARTDSAGVSVELNGKAYEASVFVSPDLGWKFIGLMERGEIYASAVTMTWMIVIASLLLVVLFMFAAFYLAGLIVNPINQVKNGLKEIAQGEGDLTRRLDIISRDETGELALWFNQFLDSIQRLVGQINQSAIQVTEVAESARSSAGNMSGASDQQLQAVEMVVAAVNEMASAANEVARNCVETATAAETGQRSTSDGKEVILATVNSVEQLRGTVEQSAEFIRQLESETQNINTILDVIRDIADQTNLLALNAAIEAARAGDQGRGFAVVADEVRGLAQRTQVSTEEINNLLNQLNSRTSQVADNMTASLDQSEQAVAYSGQARHAFEAIEASVQAINDMTNQIASAAEEQHQVSEDINRNISDIHAAASEVNNVSTQVADNSGQQARLASELSQLVSQFRV